MPFNKVNLMETNMKSDFRKVLQGNIKKVKTKAGHVQPSLIQKITIKVLQIDPSKIIKSTLILH